MAFINIVMQDEHGCDLSERINVRSSLVAKNGEVQFVCLRFVDPYGDTVFNRIQMEFVLKDLDLLESQNQKEEDRSLIEEIKTLCLRCQSEPHLYLKFI